jgi:hypothetical protein
MAEWLRTDRAVCCPAAIVHQLVFLFANQHTSTSTPTFVNDSLLMAQPDMDNYYFKAF